jgi:hypothetical protein
VRLVRIFRPFHIVMTFVSLIHGNGALYDDMVLACITRHRALY